jgi:hypothetical protein
MALNLNAYVLSFSNMKGHVSPLAPATVISDHQYACNNAARRAWFYEHGPTANLEIYMTPVVRIVIYCTSCKE